MASDVAKYSVVVADNSSVSVYDKTIVSVIEYSVAVLAVEG